MDDKQNEFNREEYDHRTDEYVSDCNRVPNFFAWPKWLTRAPDDNDDRFPLLGCLIFTVFLIGVVWICYRLGRAVISIIL
jgi:hypothetical protein